MRARVLKFKNIIIFVVLGSLGALSFLVHRDQSDQARFVLTKGLVANAIAPSALKKEFPSHFEMQIDGKPTQVIAQYSFDYELQAAMEASFGVYKPDHGAFVAIDAKTGRILSMVSFSKHDEGLGNLALRATFPAASVFKVVTAAAAIAEKKFRAHTLIPVNGSYHTLYKRNVFKETENKWTRYMTFKEAFARSVNSVFGKIGALSLGEEDLKEYAGKFGFNRPIASDLPVQEGKALIHSDPWALASTASGFTRENTMSPLQGALIAATIVNEGKTVEPYVVESVHTTTGTPVYHARVDSPHEAINPQTAMVLKEMMRETVTQGTSRGSFRKFFRGDYRFVDVGGKTGSLTGDDPKGKYDWFVGFAERSGQTIAFATLTIHRDYWTVKSAYLARLAIENYYGRSSFAQSK